MYQVGGNVMKAGRRIILSKYTLLILVALFAIFKCAFRLGTELRVTNDRNINRFPSLAWTGSEFGVSWENNNYHDQKHSIYFARISSVGKKIGNESRITNFSYQAQFPCLCWANNEFGLVWSDGRDGHMRLHFTRISADGEEIFSEKVLSNNIGPNWSNYPSLCWTGSEYGLGWMDSKDHNYEVYFVRLSPRGEKLGDEVRISNSPYESWEPSLSWTGSEYGMIWKEIKEQKDAIHFCRISTGGNKLGSVIQVNKYLGGGGVPTLVWTGSEFGASWNYAQDIYFTRISADALLHRTILKVTNNVHNSWGYSLVWTGKQFGLSWSGNRDGNHEIYITSISADGCKIGKEYRVTQAGKDTVFPSMVWTGSEFGISWFDDRNENLDDIYFITLSVPAP